MGRVTVTVGRTRRRRRVLAFFARRPRCLAGMEAGATAHHRACELSKLGHEVRLIPPAYVKAVRRGKDDTADAAATCEAVSRPSRRFVAVETAARQAAAGLHKLRALLVRQRTMVINQLRGLMAEFGLVVAKGPQRGGELAGLLAEPTAAGIPAPPGPPWCRWRRSGAPSSGGSRRSTSRSRTGAAATRAFGT